VVVIDLRLEHFANLSGGEASRWKTSVSSARAKRGWLACAQGNLAKAKVRQLPRRDARKVKVTRAYRKIRNQRLNFARKLSRRLSDTYKKKKGEEISFIVLSSIYSTIIILCFFVLVINRQIIW
jgi:transposase